MRNTQKYLYIIFIFNIFSLNTQLCVTQTCVLSEKLLFLQQNNRTIYHG